MTDTPAGWHPDPEQPGQLRYWDGPQWTEHRSPAPAAAPAPAAPAVPPPMSQMAPTAPPPVQGGYAPQGTAFVPMAPGSATPKSGGGCLKVAIIVIIIVLLIGTVSVVGLLVVGHKVVNKLDRTFGTANTSDYSVKVSTCTIVDGEVSATGTLTNRANRHQAYSITVVADDQNDDQVGTDDEFIAGLSHNETGTWSADELGEAPSSSKVTCKVQSVNYAPG